MANVLSLDEITALDAYWRAANYLSVGQIYLRDNPLLKEPLQAAHVKPRLLGHWGTTPGLNFIYVHLNRIIRKNDLSMIYIAGPGHGGPGLVANVYLEGTYSEVYPNISQDEEGIQKLFKQFSFPGGIPSHVAPETPGSIHEGGELGYALSHAYGAAFDNPDLLVACVIGDGEAETGPLATAWHSNKFLNPASDGAVLPILHLNGYKIANPTVLARISKTELESLISGYGYHPYFVEGDEPMAMHEAMAATLDTVCAEIRAIQEDARRNGVKQRPRWPMIVLRYAEGLDRTEGSRRRAGRRQLAFASSADRRCQIGRALKAPRRLDEELPPRSFIRQRRRAGARAAKTCAQGPAPHGRQSAGQRRSVAAGSAHARLSRLRRANRASWRRVRRGDASDGKICPRRDEAQHGLRATSAFSAPMKPAPTVWARCSK